MTDFKKRIVCSSTILCVGILLVCGTIGKAKDPLPKLRKQTIQVTELMKAGKFQEAKKLAKKFASQEDEHYYTLLLFEPSKKKGLGFGKGNDVFDGIELKIRYLAREPISKAELKDQSEDLLDLAYRTKAINLILQHIPSKNAKKIWLMYGKEIDKRCGDFILAVKKQNPSAVQFSASKINSNCNYCHISYRLGFYPFKDSLYFPSYSYWHAMP